MIRGIIESYYDIQAMRIEVENQLRSLGQGVSEQEEEWTKLNVLNRLKDIEKSIYQRSKLFNEQHDIYNQWLKGVVGIGNVLSAGLISWVGDVTPRQEDFLIKKGKDKGKVIKIERGYKTISKLWAYAGLHVDEKGKAVRRQKNKKSNWNSRLKTHLWKVGESFVKQDPDKSGYRKLYEDFRRDYDRKWKTPEDCGSIGCKNKGKGKCMKGHRYAAAKRKTVKVFLAHYWMKERELRGLSIEHPFIMGRDAHSHLIDIIEE